MFSYASAENFKSITADELKKMLDKKTKLVLVDARTGAGIQSGTYTDGGKHTTG